MCKLQSKRLFGATIYAESSSHMCEHLRSMLCQQWIGSNSLGKLYLLSLGWYLSSQSLVPTIWAVESKLSRGLLKKTESTSTSIRLYPSLFTLSPMITFIHIFNQNFPSTCRSSSSRTLTPFKLWGSPSSKQSLGLWAYSIMNCLWIMSAREYLHQAANWNHQMMTTACILVQRYAIPLVCMYIAELTGSSQVVTVLQVQDTSVSELSSIVVRMLTLVTIWVPPFPSGAGFLCKTL